jgi:hypothetical protein
MEYQFIPEVQGRKSGRPVAHFSKAEILSQLLEDENM